MSSWGPAGAGGHGLLAQGLVQHRVPSPATQIYCGQNSTQRKSDTLLLAQNVLHTNFSPTLDCLLCSGLLGLVVLLAQAVQPLNRQIPGLERLEHLARRGARPQAQLKHGSTLELFRTPCNAVVASDKVSACSRCVPAARRTPSVPSSLRESRFVPRC